MSDEHVDEREADRDAFARIQNAGQKRVAVVVIVVGVAGEDQLTGHQVGHDADTLPLCCRTAQTPGQLGTPSGQTLAVWEGFEAAQHGSREEPAGFLEVGAVAECGAEDLEALQ